MPAARHRPAGAAQAELEARQSAAHGQGQIPYDRIHTVLVGAYVRAIWRDWVSRMSGIASVALTFVPVFVPSAHRHWNAALWTAAAACFVFTSYWIWAKTQPILGIEIVSTHLGTGVISHESLADAYVTIEFRFCAKSGDLAIKSIDCRAKIGSGWLAGKEVPCRNTEEWRPQNIRMEVST